MRHALYLAILHQDEGGAFGLTFPDLPGCFAAADSFDQIQTAAAEAISLWMEDNHPAQPTRLVNVPMPADVMSEFSTGGMTIIIPYTH